MELSEKINNSSTSDEVKDSEHNEFHWKLHKVTEFYDKTERAVHAWRKFPGYPLHCHVKRGVIDLKILNDWHRDYFYGSAKTATTMAEEKLKHTIARRKREELLTGELDASLISKAKINDDFTFVFSVLRQRILSWVKAIPPKAANKNHKQLTKLMMDETWFILNELSQGISRVSKKSEKT